jgi:hypothetical protein
MTGFESKRQAAKAKLDDDADTLTIVYQRGFADGKRAAQPEQEAEPVSGCACRWDHEDNRVVTCERHQGWLDVIAEWADRAREAEAKLKATLAQPEQEPVAWEHHEYRPYGAPGEIRIHAVLASQYMMPDGSVAGDFQWLVDQYKADKNTIKLIPLYATPPAAQRPWQGLEIEEVQDSYNADYQAQTRAIEAKLKERNT